MIKGYLLTFLCLLGICFNLLAQKGELTYDQKAAEFQTKIWGDKQAEFEQKTIPAGMEKESAVIIAQATNIEQSSNNKLRLIVNSTRTSRLNIFRERVKLNDKAALDDYSSLEYQKSLDKTQGIWMAKYANKKDTYIGVKIIKPSGQEVIVNTSEEVLTKNETKDKKGKLAIPGLEVGDILDYYVCKVELVEDETGEQANSNYLFVMAGEHPILSYQLSMQYNNKIYVNYINANKAPEFKESTADNGDKLYSLKLTNLPKYTDNIWSSPLREYPYIEFSATLNKKAAHVNVSRLAGVVSDYETFFANKTYLYTDYKSDVKRYFKNGKGYKEQPLDSTMRVLYDDWKYRTFCNYSQEAELDMGNERNKRHAISQVAVYEVAHNLVDMEVNFDILLVSPRNSSSLDNVYERNDLKALIRINGTKPMYMCFYDMFTQFNEIPEDYQGETVVVLTPHNHKLDKFDEGTATLPVTPSNENCINSQMKVNLLPENMQKVKITRAITETGLMKNDDQQNLVLMEAYDSFFTQVLSGTEIAKRAQNKKAASEYANAFEKAREENITNFKNEVAQEFGQEPQNIADYKISNLGISSVSPAFAYNSTFVMDNFVKRAGNNYILEVGKLIGNYGKVDEKERQRIIDVYMPAARTLTYDINVAIPRGYQVKGIEELNHSQKNEVGSLNISANVQGDNLAIKVTRIYDHNFEKAAQWPKLLELLDAAYNFTTQKILLEKI
jgi:hypothetical protein